MGCLLPPLLLLLLLLLMLVYQASKQASKADWLKHDGGGAGWPAVTIHRFQAQLNTTWSNSHVTYYCEKLVLEFNIAKAKHLERGLGYSELTIRVYPVAYMLSMNPIHIYPIFFFCPWKYIKFICIQYTPFYFSRSLHLQCLYDVILYTMFYFVVVGPYWCFSHSTIVIGTVDGGFHLRLTFMAS